MLSREIGTVSRWVRPLRAPGQEAQPDDALHDGHEHEGRPDPEPDPTDSTQQASHRHPPRTVDRWGFRVRM